jgi:arylsulfatase A-like enzyme
LRDHGNHSTARSIPSTNSERRQAPEALICPDVPDWDSLPAPERRLYARMMEVFAGFLDHTDHQVGRLLDYLSTLGELENTLVMVTSDNGASAEGGPTGTTNEAQFFNNAQDSRREPETGRRAR